MSDFKSYLERSTQEIEQGTQKILTDFSQKTSKISPKLIPLIKLLVESCQGGKKIRGTLVRLGFKIGQEREGAKPDHLEVFDSEGLSPQAQTRRGGLVKVAAAFEILHASILIHDDVIDQSPLRRGKPTLYKSLGGDHYGISQAIGLADVGLFLAVKIMTDTNFPSDRKIKALSFFAQTVVKTALGEVLDVEIPHLGGVRREQDVITIHQLKTAQYTISAPLILGAILAGAKLDLLDKLDKFGESLGIAFQIQDDILGVFGSEEEIGKSVTSDIKEGKNTLLITQALKKANPKQKAFLEKYYGRGEIRGGVIEEIRNIFIKTGALNYSKKQILEYTNQAKKILLKLTKDRKLSIILEQLADYLVERNK